MRIAGINLRPAGIEKLDAQLGETVGRHGLANITMHCQRCRVNLLKILRETRRWNVLISLAPDFAV